MNFFLIPILGFLIGLLCLNIASRFYDRFKSNGPLTFILNLLCGISGSSIAFALIMIYNGYIILPMVSFYIAVKCLRLIFI